MGIVLSLSRDVLWETLMVGLDRSINCDTNLSQLSGEQRAGVEPVHVKVTPSVVEYNTNALIPQGCGLPFRYWRKETLPLKVMTDSSIAICFDRSEGGLKNWTETVKEGLDLAALGVAVRISHV